MKKNSITRFGVSIDDSLLDKFDSLIKTEGYVNRSEAIRDLIRQKLDSNAVSDPEAESLGTLSLVFSHENHELADRLNEIQHNYFGNVVSSTHVHLDQHNCLEVLILRGKAKDIKSIADRLCSLKNIRKGDLTLTSGV